MGMGYFCWSCGNEQFFDVKGGVKVGRHDECPHCGAELKVCKNCANYDPDVHNQCIEPTAEFIRDRERANFCAHFDFRSTDGAPVREDVATAKSKLEDLFKNLK